MPDTPSTPHRLGSTIACTLIATTLATTFGAGTAMAQLTADNFRSKQTGNWSAAGTWEQYNPNASPSAWEMATVAPGAGDHVEIRNHTVTIDQNVPVDTVVIRQDGLLKFDSAASSRTLEIQEQDGLTIDAKSTGTDPGKLEVTSVANQDRIVELEAGSAAMGSFDISGEIYIKGAQSSLDILANTTLDGAGTIFLENNNAAIRINGGVTLTSDIAIEGNGQIKRLSGEANAMFENDTNGTVTANTAGILEITSGVEVKGSGDWFASTSSSAKLLFSRAFDCNDVTGDFEVSGGATMEFASPSTTAGAFACVGSGTVTGSLEHGASGGSCTGGTAAAGCP